MRKWLPFLLLFFATVTQAQVSEPLRELQRFVHNQPPAIQPDSTPYLDIVHKNGLHYFLPFYKAFQLEKKLLSADTASYFQQLAEAAAFAGDNNSAIAFERSSYEVLPDSVRTEINKLSVLAKDAVYTDAKKFILSKAASRRVVMINEAHDKPQTHAFILSLLEDMYARGFHYLASDLLYNRGGRPVTRLNFATGYYTNESLAGELIRKALEIGYVVVPYEDTIAVHTINQREYAQAENLFHLISQKEAGAKMLVIAGTTHIEKGARGERIPMAAYFKIVSGIDPLTIDQTEMTEGSMHAYGALLYDLWMAKNPAIGPSIALHDNLPEDPFGFYLYDLHVIHPPTRYVNARPDWVSVNGLRQETQVFPAFRSLFLVQAYYAKEYSPAMVNQSVPADQTYVPAQTGVYYLYLQKGKYKLVCRDKSYEILGTREIEVK